VVEAVTLVAEALLKTPVISDNDLKELVLQAKQRLIQDDYSEILPACARV